MEAALVGRRVVLTQQRAGRLAELLQALGANVDRVPLTDVADAHDGGVALADALGRLDRFDWLVVTSVNGARRVGEAARRAPDVRLATVGAATANVLAELAGRPVDLLPAIQRVAGLLEEFPVARPAESPSRVLTAQGDLATSALVDGLRERGHTVTAIEAYRTVPRPLSAEDRQTMRNADAVVLASGSAAGALAGTDGVSAAVVVIGPVTAAAARDAGLSVAAMAASPGDDDVVAAIVACVA